MQIFHLIDEGSIDHPVNTHVEYGRYLVQVRPDGSVVCDDHLFRIEGTDPPVAGDKLLVWCSHDYYCCREADYEAHRG